MSIECFISESPKVRQHFATCRLTIPWIATMGVQKKTSSFENNEKKHGIPKFIILYIGDGYLMLFTYVYMGSPNFSVVFIVEKCCFCKV